jgi:hypothetical protein
LCDGRDSNRVQTGALLLEQSCWWNGSQSSSFKIL